MEQPAKELATEVGSRFSGAFDDSGEPIFLQPRSGLEITEWSVISPVAERASVEQPSYVTFAFEIAGNTIIKALTLYVIRNDVGVEDEISFPPIGVVSHPGQYFSVLIEGKYDNGKRLFKAALKNWSHSWGRNMQFKVTYTTGTKAGWREQS
jgi:hypothetical protein